MKFKISINEEWILDANDEENALDKLEALLDRQGYDGEGFFWDSLKVRQVNDGKDRELGKFLPESK